VFLSKEIVRTIEVTVKPWIMVRPNWDSGESVWKKILNIRTFRKIGCATKINATKIQFYSKIV
jgi:hypothetical protein